MASCIAFQMKNIEDAHEHWSSGWETVEEYGSSAHGHKLHIWDDGGRKLCRCQGCGGYLLYQRSEYHSDTDDASDSFYSHFFPVETPAEAEELNFRYDGFQIEAEFRRRFLCATNGRYRWAGSIEESDEPEW